MVILISLVVPILMAIINLIVEHIITFDSTFARPLNETRNLLDSITGISWI